MLFKLVMISKLTVQDVPTAIDLARKTFRRIQINYFWTFFYNVCMIPLASGALYAPIRFQLPPWVSPKPLFKVQV